MLVYRKEDMTGVGGKRTVRVSHLNRLSENAKFEKLGSDIKGLMTQEFAKIPILGQPVYSWRKFESSRMD